MSPEEYGRICPDSDDFGGTELTLALPGTPTKASEGFKKSGNKRRFLETGEGHKNNYISSMITKYGVLIFLSLHVVCNM